jgi:hypothetical protein
MPKTKVDRSYFCRQNFFSLFSRVQVDASYVYYSSDGDTDRFTFVIAVPASMSVGDHLEFAVRYEVDGGVHWDNNFGKNYSVACHSSINAQTDIGQPYMRTWLHYL